MSSIVETVPRFKVSPDRLNKSEIEPTILGSQDDLFLSTGELLIFFN